MPHVERGGRLVEQQDVALLRERARERDARLLAAGQRGERARREVRDVGVGHGPRDDGVVLGRAGRAAPRVATHGHDVERTERERHARLLQHDRASPREVDERLPPQVDAVEQHASRVGPGVARQHREQGRLARAVGPDERDELAAAHVQVDVVEDDGRAVRDAHAARREPRAHAQPPAARRVRRMSQKKNGPPTSAVSMPIGRSA